MTKVEELAAYLTKNNLRLGGFFPGTDPSTTDEQRAEAILNSLRDLEKRAESGPPHECPDWDGLMIYPCDPEMGACTCSRKFRLSGPMEPIKYGWKEG